jgi:hypothetical protein
MDLMLKVRRARMDRLRRDAMRNAARLAAANPQLYNEIMAGMQLPQDAWVIGGQPRTDLLEELAYDMATGARQQTDPQQELLEALGA